MTKHIGILGCSAEGAALCYRTVCLEAEPLMGKHAHPEVTLHTIALAEYMEPLSGKEDWPAVGEIMLRSVQALERAGADFVICPDNTAHAALPYVLPRSPLPWLHIAEEVGREAQRRGFKKLGLTGTRFLVNSDVYPDKLTVMGIGHLRPTPEQREGINTIIFDELVRGRQTPEALRYLQQVIDDLRAQGCDAVVLGCTEIPLLINDEVSSLPTLDSTRTLARAALRHALAETRVDRAAGF
ncbi:MAG TPA: amino acid racemase [Candidatus Angelobacter sp.]|nr:amino acid racemase [Candidatus Angelobacter sp.]